MMNFWQDVRYGMRMLFKNPGFAAIAILTLALGIGANTALFSVVNGVLLNPLPFPEPDQLYAVYYTTPAFERSSVSYPNFLDWQKQNHSLSALGAFRAEDLNLTGSGEPERLHGHMISSEFFPALGLPPLLGRNFRPEEDKVGAGPVAIIGDGLWKRKFGQSPEVLGKSISLNGETYTIVGVFPGRMPVMSASDVYTPLGQWDDATFRDRRIGMGTNSIGRVKPGVSQAQLRADMDSVAQNLAAAYPDADKGGGINIVPLKTDVVGDVRGILLVLLGAVTFVLLIACANVANLLLARSTGRSREFAIRAAIGAGPGRVIRQLLTESVLLGIAGGGFGPAARQARHTRHHRRAARRAAARRRNPPGLARSAFHGRYLHPHRNNFRPRPGLQSAALRHARNSQRRRPRLQWRSSPHAKRLRGHRSGHGPGSPRRSWPDDSQSRRPGKNRSRIRSAQHHLLQHFFQLRQKYHRARCCAPSTAKLSASSKPSRELNLSPWWAARCQ